MKLWVKISMLCAVGVLIGVGLIFVAFLLFIERTPIQLSKVNRTSTQTVVYDRSGSVLMKIGNTPSNLTYQQIPKILGNALVATEDHTYWTSSSIDFRSLFRALMVDVIAGSPSQGASTIQEQLAKIIYLNDNKTLSYKLHEIAMGVQINRYFTKQEILAMYLNKVYLGEGTMGAEQAAQRYFGINLRKNPDKLTLDQAALLAGLPQAPSAYDPLVHPKAATQRRNEVLQQMYKYGYISSKTEKVAEQKPLGVSYHPISQDIWKAHPLASNFLFDYAAKHGISNQQLLQGGLKIYTTLDPNVQQAVDKVFWSTNYDGDFPGPTSGTVVQGAAVFVDPRTGGILGAAGSRQQGYTKLGLDRIYSNSSPGSSIKPIMEYAPALQSGKWTPISILNNQTQNFGGGYVPQNWEGPNGPKRVTLQYGLQWSQNIASVWLLKQIGLRTGTQFAMKDGIQLTAQDRRQLGVAIGGMQYGVNPLEMAQAYEAFDNQGVQMRVHLINKIVNQDGQTIYTGKSQSKKVMSSSTAIKMTSLLQDVVDYGTGTAAKVSGVAVAGKTGTVQYSAGLTGHSNWVRDAWFDGYTPTMVGSIHLGYDQSSATHHMTMSPLDPSANAAKIFGDIVRLVNKHRKLSSHFAQGPFPAWQGTASAVNQIVDPIASLTAKWNAHSKTIRLHWNANSKVSIKEFRISKMVQQSTKQSLNTIGQTTNTSFIDHRVQTNTTYVYEIQAVNGNGAPIGNPQKAVVKTTTPLKRSAKPNNSSSGLPSVVTGHQSSSGSPDTNVTNQVTSTSSNESIPLNTTQ